MAWSGAAQEHPSAAAREGVAAPAPPAGDPEHHRQQVASLLLGLTLILVGAKVGGEVFERVRQPAVLGELLAGIVLGNLSLLGIGFFESLERHEVLLALSEVGVILLLFEVGLESDLQEMWRVGLSSILVATLGVVTPFFLGWGVSAWLLPEQSSLVHVFIGATLCATSVGITARVLRDMGELQRPESRIVLGAAVVDDVMGLVILAVVQGMIRAQAGAAPVDAGAIAWLIIKAILFLVGAIVLGRLLAPQLFRLASYLQGQHVLLVVSVGICFTLAWLANEIGLAFIVGAFAAGLILDPITYRSFTDRGEHHIEELIRPTAALLVPIFFVVTGMAVDLRVLGDPATLAFAAALIVVAILGKQVCSLGVVERGLDRLSVGLGMIPRGEVGLIFANIGRGLVVVTSGQRLPVVNDHVFGAVVVMVMVTTLLTPPLLAWSLRRSAKRGARGG
ncbi:MAG: cation:proton antiporter [Armatimonadetes bacterium]|nr:cation:proton antiporter [Armatimonadota bacterium]